MVNSICRQDLHAMERKETDVRELVVLTHAAWATDMEAANISWSACLHKFESEKGTGWYENDSLQELAHGFLSCRMIMAGTTPAAVLYSSTPCLCTSAHLLSFRYVHRSLAALTWQGIDFLLGLVRFPLHHPM